MTITTDVMTMTKVKLNQMSYDLRSYFIKGKVVVEDGDGSQPKTTGRSYCQNKRPTCNCNMDKFHNNK